MTIVNYDTPSLGRNWKIVRIILLMGKEKGTVVESLTTVPFLMGYRGSYTSEPMISSRLSGSKSITGISGMV